MALDDKQTRKGRPTNADRISKLEMAQDAIMQSQKAILSRLDAMMNAEGNRQKPGADAKTIDVAPTVGRKRMLDANGEMTPDDALLGNRPEPMTKRLTSTKKSTLTAEWLSGLMLEVLPTTDSN